MIANVAVRMHSMKTVTRLLAYWLLPAESARSEFARRIENLARHYHAPVFAPHVTIYAGTVEEAPDPAATRAVLEQVGRRIPPFTWKSRGSARQRFTKTLFVEFADHHELSALSRELQGTAMFQSAYELHPHLSLLYAHCPKTRSRRSQMRCSCPSTLWSSIGSRL